MPLRRSVLGPQESQLKAACGKICEVSPAAEGQVLFLKSPNSEACQHKIVFGDGEICTCPVRRNIYEEYGV